MQRLLSIIKRILYFCAIVFSIVEYYQYPRFEILLCIISTWVSLFLFCKYVLKPYIVREYPIALFAFSNLFCFMYLPIPITLLDGRPADYMMFIPKTTYILQLVYYMVTFFSFKFCIRNEVSINRLRAFLVRCGFYPKTSTTLLWIIGVLGILARLSLMFSGIGAGVGLITNLSMLMYAPILILFHPLLGGTECGTLQKKMVYIYILCIFVLLIGTNGRHYIITPIIIYLCFSALKMINSYKASIISIKKLIIGVVGVVIFLGPMSDLAASMVIVRSLRSDISPIELITETYNVYKDKEIIEQVREKAKNFSEEGSTSWNEEYVTNEFFARFCNYRVVDASIYHAMRTGFFSSYMFEKFINEILKLPPEPIPSMIFKVDKNDKYSQMDYLYALSTHTSPFPSLRVGGDVGLGLSIFGPFYFFIQFFIYVFLFRILCSLTYTDNNKIIVSLFAGLYLMDLFYTFTVHSGILNHVSFILWTFWFYFGILILVYRLICRIIRG